MNLSKIPNVNYNLNLEKNLGEEMKNFGFQASNLNRACEICKEMKDKNATVFLSFTSNMVATGLRTLFSKLVEKKFVDCIVTAGGSIDHDLILSYLKYKHLINKIDDESLHKKEMNRIYNILISNSKYILLEEKIKPILKKCMEEKITSPSKIIYEISKTINDKQSILYWTYKNKIPVFCPGIVDSAIGLQTYFFKNQKKDFVIDVTDDLLKLGQIVLDSQKTGGILLGGGISKHHTIASNILKGGLDYAVYISTASEFDGSLSGAKVNEAVSWGKINEKSNKIDVNCDATICFPIICQYLKTKGYL